ncbi:hypothetical protein LSPCS325_04670 [Lysinibacillus sp. CTST325]
MGAIEKKDEFFKKIYSDKLGFLMEAHNGLSVKVVEEVGIKGIWASGLSIYGSLGVRDNNECWHSVLQNVNQRTFSS